PLVVDGNPATGWSTEHYQQGPALKLFGKSGVGLILTVDRPVAARTMTIDTPHSGWTASIYGASSGPPSSAPPPGWTTLAGSTDINNTTQTIELSQESTSRYYLIWITSLTGAAPSYSAQINSVKLSS